MTRIPPHSDESEMSVVGAAILHSRAFVDAVQYVDAADFYHPGRRTVWEAMVTLFRESKPIDEATVVQAMTEAGTLGMISAFGGAGYLTDLAASVVTTENVAYHAKAVRSKADRRRAVAQLQELIAKAYGEEGDGEFFSALDEAMLSLSLRRSEDGGLQPFRHALREAVTAIGQRYEHRGEIHGVPWGLGRVDKLVCGSREGDLVVVGGRPSMGKTALVEQVVLHAAGEGHPGALYSLEMSRCSLAERALASRSGVAGKTIRTGMLGVPDWGRVQRSASELAELPVAVDDRARTIATIRSRALRWRASLPKDCKTPVIGIDYAQLVESSEDARKKRSREQEVSEVSRTAKAMAVECRAVVFLLAQLSRECEKRTDKRPLLSDLRESGSIEQDADLVAFIYRDDYYSKDRCKPEDKGIAEIIVAKQRNGATGTVRVGFQAECTRFVDLAERDDAPAYPHHTEVYDK